jgi:hypothetical protein
LVGTYELTPEGTWKRLRLKATHPAVPTVAEWSHEVDGKHTYDVNIVNYVEEAINMFWNSGEQYLTGLLAIRQRSRAVNDQIDKLEAELKEQNEAADKLHDIWWNYWR